MKIRYSLLILALLFPLVSKSEQNTLTAHRENIMSKPDYTNALTPQERADLIATIKIAITFAASVIESENILHPKAKNATGW